MSSDFMNLLERLVRGGVDFVIVGGFAGVVHGCTYVTQDMDICCEFSAANLLALQAALCDVHPVHRMTPDRKELKLTEEDCGQFKNLYLDTDIGQLDCVGFIDGVGDYSQVKQASEVVDVQEMRLRTLGLDGLIKAKKAMNRPRDREAVVQLEAIKKLKQGGGQTGQMRLRRTSGEAGKQGDRRHCRRLTEAGEGMSNNERGMSNPPSAAEC